jgi:hypothetical protein
MSATLTPSLTDAMQQLGDRLKNADPSQRSIVNLRPTDPPMNQGDVRVRRLAKGTIDARVKKGELVRATTPSSQVAPGNTEGARHEIEDMSTVEIYVLKNGNAIDGPFIKFKGPNALRHPQHGDIVGFDKGDEFCFPGDRKFAADPERIKD